MATGQLPDVVSESLKSEADKFTNHFFSGIFINGNTPITDNAVSGNVLNSNAVSGNVLNSNAVSDNNSDANDNSGPIERILPGPGVQGPTVATMETIKPLNP
jgi:hypothetical protein